jgi:hypothetical protein
MYQLRFHNFFRVHLPKNRDPENMDWADVFLEESKLIYGDQIKNNRRVDSNKFKRKPKKAPFFEA